MPPDAHYRILLDQNFPKPPNFDIADIDSAVEVVHLRDFDPSLAEAATPDWMLYLRAADAGFDAFVTRDASQRSLVEEMWVLSRLRLTLVTFRQSIEDPIAEWGQLLAYMPLLRRRTSGAGPVIVLLPKPRLGSDNLEKPVANLHQIAADRKLSFDEIRRDARSGVEQHLAGLGMTGTYTALLSLQK